MVLDLKTRQSEIFQLVKAELEHFKVNLMKLKEFLDDWKGDDEQMDELEIKQDLYLEKWISESGGSMTFRQLHKKICESAVIELVGENHVFSVYDGWFDVHLAAIAAEFYSEMKNEDAIALIDALADEERQDAESTLKNIIKSEVDW